MPPRPHAQVPDVEAMWATIRTALDRLFVFPEDLAAAAVEEPRALAPAEYSLAYTAVFQWVTSSRTPAPAAEGLYQHMEGYFTQLCTSVYGRLASTPQDRLAHTYASVYRGFDRRMAVVGRLAAYIDRHSARCAREEGRGWLPSGGRPWIPVREEGVPVPPYQKSGPPMHGAALPTKEQLRSQRERQALDNYWELPLDALQGSAAWNDAITRAEAGSDPGTVVYVGVRALGLRRWRLGVLEPLLQDSLPQLLSGANDDRAMLEQLASFMKDVGIKSDDVRRQQVGRELENVARREGQ
jgi:hypothetical protein